MPPKKTDLFRAAAAVLAAAVISGCSSSGSSPVRLIPSSRPAANDSGTAFAVTVRSDAGTASSAAFTPKVMNGSNIDVVVTGARDAAAGYIDAAGSRVALVKTADGSWHGTLQYVDESNPPPKNPALDVGMQFPSGEVSVHHIPIVEMHD
jgi:hypothetical protein